MSDDDKIIWLPFSTKELRYNEDHVICEIVLKRVLEAKRQLPPLLEDDDE